MFGHNCGDNRWPMMMLIMETKQKKKTKRNQTKQIQANGQWKMWICNTAKFEMFNYLLTKWQTNLGTPIVSLPVYFPFLFWLINSLFFISFYNWNLLVVNWCRKQEERKKKLKLKLKFWQSLFPTSNWIRKRKRDFYKLDEFDGHMNVFLTHTR